MRLKSGEKERDKGAERKNGIREQRERIRLERGKKK